MLPFVGQGVNDQYAGTGGPSLLRLRRDCRRFFPLSPESDPDLCSSGCIATVTARPDPAFLLIVTERTTPALGGASVQEPSKSKNSTRNNPSPVVPKEKERTFVRPSFGIFIRLGSKP